MLWYLHSPQSSLRVFHFSSCMLLRQESQDSEYCFPVLGTSNKTVLIKDNNNNKWIFIARYLTQAGWAHSALQASQTNSKK